MNSRILLLFLLLCTGNALGQALSLGCSISASNYSGDLTQNNTAILAQTKPGFGLNMSYFFDQYFSFSGYYEHLKIYADDAYSTADWQLRRNLNFQSKIHSFDFSGSINLRSLLLPGVKRVNLYGSLGYTVFNFNPIANFNSHSYALQPLGTEGQGMPGYQSKYKLWASGINFGMAIEYRISNKFSVQSRILFRKTNTDYLDDISNSYVDYNFLSENNGIISAELGNKIKAQNGSQRGNPLDKDWYQSLSLGVQYLLFDNNSNTLYKDKKRAVNCPRFKY